MTQGATFIAISHTNSSDNAESVSPTQTPLIFQELDIQILTNDAYYGDKNIQEFELSAGDIVSFRSSAGVNLTDIFFKNQNAGNNTKIVAVGLLK
ncbi:MAG: hypothetical protein BV457_09460 [Thermoplasmata archaeon M9B1D]|nr:MAG: hypothetical protein BV457_09460 [Thermoplasmata archaeon M9B1D]